MVVRAPSEEAAKLTAYSFLDFDRRVALVNRIRLTCAMNAEVGAASSITTPTGAFSIYGDALGFEWQQIEQSEPVLFSLAGTESGRERTISHQTIDVPDRQELLPKDIAAYTREAVHSDGRHLSFGQGGGRSGSHPHLVHEFISSVRERRPAAIDAVTAANWTAPGIAAHASALQDGAATEVPDFSKRGDPGC